MNEKEESKIIQVSEDKLRLTLKEQNEHKSSSSKFWTFLSFSLAFGIPLFTSTFNGFWILSAELLQAIFIVITFLFFSLAFFEAVKVIKSKITGKGDDDWFVLRVQGLEKPKKESSFGEAIVDFFCFTDWIDVIKKTGLILLYLLPIGLWILVISLVGWTTAWSTEILINNEIHVWVLTLAGSLFWFLATYFHLIVYRHEILSFLGIDYWF